MSIKVLIINGSPRVHGNTSHMLGWIKADLEKEGIECEYYQLGGKDIKSCKSCWRCKETGKCWQEDPVIDELVEKFRNVDGIIIGSPTYYADVPMEVKGMLDRCGLICGKDMSQNEFDKIVNKGSTNY